MSLFDFGRNYEFTMLTVIEPQLRHLFSSIETVLKVSFIPDLFDQIVFRSENDDLPTTFDLLEETNKIQIRGEIYDYEHETLWIAFSGLKLAEHKQLERLEENYRFAFGSSFRSEEESLGIFKRMSTTLNMKLDP